MSYTSFPCANCKNECLSELVGTYSLVLVGPGSVVTASVLGLMALWSSLFVGISFGGTVASIMILLGGYSAHLNPAVTVAHYFGRLRRSGSLFAYALFQILGGILAGLTLAGIFGPSGSKSSLGSTKLASGIGPVTGVAVELVGTFALSMAALGASCYVRSRILQALLVGGTLFTLIQLFGQFTGAGFNPARSVGPAVASGYLQDWYVYWVGPMVGGMLAGLVFAMVRRRNDARRKKELGFVCMCP